MTRSAYVLLFLAAAFSCLAAQNQDLRQQFRDWKIKYNKVYPGLRSEIDRYRQFRRSAEQIKHINSIQNSWVADFTEFADLSEEERTRFLGIPQNNTLEEEQPAPVSRLDEEVLSYPVEKLWEMTPVRSQGTCGSCWSFAAVAALEGWLMKEHGEYRELSEQAMLDCTFEGRRDGCDGGWSTNAINWAGSRSPISKSSRHGYLPLRSDRKYEGEDGSCFDLDRPQANALTRAKPYAYHARDPSDNGLLKALLTEGPAVVYIHASWQFQFYQFGLYKGMGCGGKTTNHAVTATGYGVDYFKIKNSWGKLWGRSGYAYFDRTQRNLCKIASSRISIDWNPNTHWDVCTDSHPDDRTTCIDNMNLSESACRSKGCCFDPRVSGPKQCFRQGQITVYDGEGHKRTLYGSTPDFADLEFARAASSVEVQSGKWMIYERDDYSKKGRYQIITAKNGRVTTAVESVEILL